eukprot:6789708-Ditylum_brightwellii.AAC.1
MPNDASCMWTMDATIWLVGFELPGVWTIRGKNGITSITMSSGGKAQNQQITLSQISWRSRSCPFII